MDPRLPRWTRVGWISACLMVLGCGRLGYETVPCAGVDGGGVTRDGAAPGDASPVHDAAAADSGAGLDGGTIAPLDAGGGRDAGPPPDAGPLGSVTLVEVGTVVQVTDDTESIGGVSIAEMGGDLAIAHGDFGGSMRMRFSRIGASGDPAVVAVPFDGSTDLAPRIAWNGTRFLAAFQTGTGNGRVSVNALDADGVSLLSGAVPVTPSSTVSRFGAVAALGADFAVVSVEDGALATTRVAQDGAVLASTQPVAPAVPLGLLAQPLVQESPDGTLVVYWADPAGEGGVLRLSSAFEVLSLTRLPDVPVLAVVPQRDAIPAVVLDGANVAFTVFEPDGSERAARVPIGLGDSPGEAAAMVAVGAGFAVLFAGEVALELVVLDAVGRVIGGPEVVVDDIRRAATPRLWWTGAELRAIYQSDVDGDDEIYLRRYQVLGGG